MASIFEGFKSKASTIMFKDSGGTQVTFALDATEAINTSLSASLTVFPIEDRNNITDHIQPNPLVLNLDCFISESPSQQILSIASGLLNAAIGTVVPAGISRTFASAIVKASTFAAASMVGKNDGKDTLKSLLMDRSEHDPDYPKRAMQGLIKMFQAGTTFTLHTFFTKTIYTNMAMTSLTFDQNSSGGDSLTFSMTCEQVKTTSAFSQDTKLELKAVDPASSSLSKTDSKGKVTPTEAATPANSILYNGGGFLIPQ